MRRFTTAIVANTSLQTLAKSATHLGLRTATFVERKPDMTDASNGTTPWIYAPDFRGLPLEVRAVKLEAELNAMTAELNVKLLEKAALVERYRLWKVVVMKLRLPKASKLASKFGIAAHEESLAVVAQALKIVEEDFQRCFNTGYSLLRIWQTPCDRLDDEAATALKAFLDANERWLSPPVQVDVFFAWEEVRERCNKRVRRPTRDAPRPQRDDLKVALDVCCRRLDNDVRASLLEVILQSVEKPRGEPAIAPSRAE